MALPLLVLGTGGGTLKGDLPGNEDKVAGRLGLVKAVVLHTAMPPNGVKGLHTVTIAITLTSWQTKFLT